MSRAMRAADLVPPRCFDPLDPTQGSRGGDDVSADPASLAQVSATAHGIRLDADGLTSLRGARIPRLDGDVLLSFDDLNRELGASQVTFTGEGGDRIRAHGVLPVAGHDLRLRAEATIRRQGERGIGAQIGGIRLDIGDLATYHLGTRATDGLHLTPKASADLAHLARETRKAKALLSVPAIVRRLGVPEGTVRAALSGALGLDPELLDSLSRLTRPALADRLSLAFELPEPEEGDMRLRYVRVEKDGIRVRLTGSGPAVGRP
ncbi:hypothetical protein J2X68_000874 [Streptomyces sp. 3330]|nr:hypothetical protein [Streptomyces sp. 3330]